MTAVRTLMVQDGPMTHAGEDRLPRLDLVGPIAGFPDHRHFVLVELDASGLLCALRSLHDPTLRFLVVPPGPFFPDYVPEIGDGWVEQLDLTSPEEGLVLLIVTPGASAADATVNLLAPVVINVRNRRAAQVVLDGPSWPLREPLRAAA
jgi:flagellar assembly factor FliW